MMSQLQLHQEQGAKLLTGFEALPDGEKAILYYSPDKTHTDILLFDHSLEGADKESERQVLRERLAFELLAIAIFSPYALLADIELAAS